MTWPARVLGALTVLYSLAVLLRPAVLTKPTTLSGSNVPAPVAAAARAIAARDTVIGLAMVFVPAGAALYTALAVRIASDLTDIPIFGAVIKDGATRLKLFLVAGGWAVLGGLAWWIASR